MKQHVIDQATAHLRDAMRHINAAGELIWEVAPRSVITIVCQCYESIDVAIEDLEQWEKTDQN